VKTGFWWGILKQRPFQWRRRNVDDKIKVKDKAIPLQASWFQGVEAPRFQDISAHEGGKVVSRTHTGRLYPPGNIPGTHFCYRMSHPGP
jgi:hypothetical protein